MNLFIWSRHHVVLLLLVVLSTVISSLGNSAADSFVKQDFCLWTVPKCMSKQNSTNSFKIDTYIVNNDNDLLSNQYALELVESVTLAARVWLRIIKSRPARAIQMHLPEGCGPTGKVMVGNLVICISMGDFGNDETIAGAYAVETARSDHLPRVVVVWINSNMWGEYDKCKWNNIFMHEFGHALGFTDEVFISKGLLYHHDNNKARSMPVFLGKHTRREWQKMGGLKKSNIYPPLFPGDGSHWPDTCFNTHELMLRAVDSTTSEHPPISRMTLAVFQDLGYNVDMKCADRHIQLLDNTCRRGKKGPDTMRKKAAREGTKKIQTMRYKTSMEITSLRKYFQRNKAWLSRKLRRRWIPKVQKPCRKIYRRIRRLLKLRIRGALPTFSV